MPSLESRGIITRLGREKLAKSAGGLLRDPDNQKIYLELMYFCVGEGGHVASGDPNIPFETIDPATRVNETTLAKPILISSTEVWKKPITEIDYIGNGTLRILITMDPAEPIYPRILRPGDPPTLPPNIYILSEVGLLDQNGDLIFYVVHPPEFKPSGTPVHNTIYVTF